MVGEQTHAYLKCLQQYYTLWDCVSNAIEIHFGKSQVERIMEDEFYNIGDKIQNFIKEKMYYSISETIGYDT